MPNTTKKTLTARQEAALAKHKEHHTAKHMALMRREMKNGNFHKPTKWLRNK